MERLDELYVMKAEYEEKVDTAKAQLQKAQVYVEVIDEMIAREKAKCIEQPNEEVVDELVEQPAFVSCQL